MDFLPDSEPEWGHDIHFMPHREASPDHVWHQNHVGVYYSGDGARSFLRFGHPVPRI